jgi:hypothetical protein
MLIDGEVACVWAITYRDPQIWEDDDNNSSLYIHRIATNPNFSGNNLVKQMVGWATAFAQERSLILTVGPHYPDQKQKSHPKPAIKPAKFYPLARVISLF